MQQEIETIFTNEIDINVFDSTFYQAVFNDLINIWEGKENGPLCENKNLL